MPETADTPPARPPVIEASLLLVSDFEPGGKTWADEIAAVEVFLADPHGVPAEIVVMEATGPDGRAPAPPEALTRHACVRVGVAGSHRSAALKDAGLALCTKPLVAVVEADCLPRPGWLAAVHARMMAEDRPDVVSSRTVYPDDTPLQRVMTLLDRAYLEWPTRREGHMHVSNNGALYRREVLERFPYPDDHAADANPFVSAERRQAMMMQAGVRSALAEEAEIVHAFGGWPFLADVRRNKGYQDGVRVHRRAEEAGAPPPGRLATAVSAKGMGLRRDLAAVWHRGRRRLRPLDWPLLAAMLVVLRVWEVQGALLAGRDAEMMARTAYR